MGLYAAALAGNYMPGLSAGPAEEEVRNGGGDAYDILRTKGWRRLSAFTVPMFMPNGAAAWIGIELGARAGVHTAVSACASGAGPTAVLSNSFGFGGHNVTLAFMAA